MEPKSTKRDLEMVDHLGKGDNGDDDRQVYPSPASSSTSPPPRRKPKKRKRVSHKHKKKGRHSAKKKKRKKAMESDSEESSTSSSSSSASSSETSSSDSESSQDSEREERKHKKTKKRKSSKKEKKKKKKERKKRKAKKEKARRKRKRQEMEDSSSDGSDTETKKNKKRKKDKNKKRRKKEIDTESSSASSDVEYLGEKDLSTSKEEGLKGEKKDSGAHEKTKPKSTRRMVVSRKIPGVPEEWEERWSKTKGKFYIHNNITGHSYWKLPEELEALRVPQPSVARTSSRSKSRSQSGSRSNSRSPLSDRSGILRRRGGIRVTGFDVERHLDIAVTVPSTTLEDEAAILNAERRGYEWESLSPAEQKARRREDRNKHITTVAEKFLDSVALLSQTGLNRAIESKIVENHLHDGGSANSREEAVVLQGKTGAVEQVGERAEKEGESESHEEAVQGGTKEDEEMKETEDQNEKGESVQSCPSNATEGKEKEDDGEQHSTPNGHEEDNAQGNEAKDKGKEKEKEKEAENVGEAKDAEGDHVEERYLELYPELEVVRYEELQKLQVYLRKRCIHNGMSQEPPNSFQRWIFVRKMMEIVHGLRSTEPLIPVLPGVDVGLKDQLEEAGVSPNRAVEICMSLSEQAATSAQLVGRLYERCKRKARAAAHTVQIEKYNMYSDLMFGDLDVRINANRLENLFKYYEQCYPNEKEQFLERLFCMLLRYESLAGPGYQMALPEVAFDVLRDNFGVTHECFASPLNNYLPSFCSAFPDTDVYFGSKGDMFRMQIPEEGGGFEANPPFVEETMMAMAMFIENVLNKEASKPLCFVVIVPGWDDTPSYEVMANSKHLKKLLTFERNNHIYKEGNQHKKRRQYKSSDCTTFVFFLQNESGAAKWPVTEEATKKFVTAFMSG